MKSVGLRYNPDTPVTATALNCDIIVSETCPSIISDMTHWDTNYFRVVILGKCSAKKLGLLVIQRVMSELDD